MAAKHGKSLVFSRLVRRALIKWRGRLDFFHEEAIYNMTFRYHGRSGSTLAAMAAFLAGVLAWAPPAEAQLRIVTYNTATGNPAPGVQTARPGMNIVLKSIGEELRNGIARPIDVLLLQEQFSTNVGDDALDDVATQSFVDLMNSIYGTLENPTPYARGVVDALTSHPMGQAGGPGIVYNTQTVQLIAEHRFGTVNTSAQARSTLRYQLRPVGYNPDADFYIYNSHYKAGSSTAEKNQRELEATSIRTHVTYGSDWLGEGAHVLYVGDYNMQSSSEDAFQTLIAAGDGQAHDPINRLGSWSGVSSFADVHTQAPCQDDDGTGTADTCFGLTAGGMDDRFDFQLMTGEVLDGSGFTYVSNSYRTFGNNGTTFQDDINHSSNTYVFQGVTSYTSTQILNALHSVSDHLPVIADFQLDAPPPNPQVLAARWTFETSQPTATDEEVITDIAPETGTGNARGVHDSELTDYSSPVGNGSAESFSSNRWAVGDFYEFQISTEGYENISISFDQTSSNTGPRDFGISYSTTGIEPFDTTGITYTVLANDSPNPTWSSESPHAEFSYQFDLSGFPELDDQATMFLRLVDLSDTSANGGTVGTSGTSRVDNFSIFYYAIPDGDFNEDGSVDAADYVMWRKLNGDDTTAYNEWMTNFGRTYGESGGSDQLDSPSVPEPAAAVLLMLATCLLTTRRGTLTAWTNLP
jgi:hypothetical protein